jgi:UDP-3-O-[3-hydroxymyristoyl] N-acetylglucosamine deacetylase/3-hydroxyacyl-[acyl-carrier-protein] dehydratase
MSAQRTIARETVIEGIGLHSGAPCRVVIRPGAPDTGRVFVRTDLPGTPSIKGHPDFLCKRQRRTALADGPVEIHTPEHMLAAATGLGIDNLVIAMNAQEMPGLDGSALPFVEALRSAGIVEQAVARKTYTVTEPIAISDDKASIVALPYHNGLRITYTLDDHGGVFSGPMMIDLEVTEESFLKLIAPSRTFCTRKEVEMLRAAGLGLGATTANTLIFDGPSPVDNTLRFPDEAARHKVLDLIGDLAMTTRHLNAHIVAVRSGHHTNMGLVQALNRRIVQAEKPEVVLDIQGILKALPHRPPFLLVDRCLEIDVCKSIVCIKNVTITEPWFVGHFPDDPVMPGVLLVEAIAQTAALLLLSDPRYKGLVPYFLSMDRVKFRRAVRPGDQLRIEVETIRLRSRMGACLGRVFVKDQLACEAEIRSMFLSPDEKAPAATGEASGV